MSAMLEYYGRCLQNGMGVIFFYLLCLKTDVMWVIKVVESMMSSVFQCLTMMGVDNVHW